MHPNKRNFAEGMELILKKWTALQLAIDMEWGGHTTAEKALDLEDSLLDYFEKGTLVLLARMHDRAEGKHLEPQDLEDILYEVMRDEFGALLEDGSEIEVPRASLFVSKPVLGCQDYVRSLR